MDISEKFQKKIPLSLCTTFRIGGPAKYFFSTADRNELRETLNWARANNEKVFILGGGSNVLFPDEGFAGLVIKFEPSGIEYKEQDNILLAECDSGAFFSKLILEVSRWGYSGIEWGFGIPGTVGGAVCGNAGRVDREISQVVKKVLVLSPALEELELSKEECGFSYRNSRFKKSGEVILKITFEFQKKAKEEIDELAGQSKKIMERAPQFPSAGCAFKNYILKENDSLLERPEIAERVRSGKIGAGFLIEQCGLKGKKVGGAQIWEEHANYIINLGQAKSADVRELIALAKRSVKEKFGVELEEEIRIL